MYLKFDYMDLSRISIGDSYRHNSGDSASPCLLALATLGVATQKGLFLFMSLLPRWPGQVQLVSLSPAL
jgi:hypothetical protein